MVSSQSFAAKQTFSSRDFRGEGDLVDMQHFLMEARSQTDDWHYPHVGELQFAFFMVLSHLDPCKHVRLWHNASGALVAYAILGEDPSIDWQVAPGLEWSGLEDEAMRWAKERLSQLRAQDAVAWSRPLVSGARQDNPARIGFLQGHGFRFSGQFAEVNMLRSLEQAIPVAAPPATFQVRPIVSHNEVHSRAAAQRDVWQPWTVGNVTDGDYSRFMLLPGYHRDLDVVAVSEGGDIAAYANGWIDPVNKIGDFGPVGALPRYRRLGLTRAVLLDGMCRMRAYGMNRVCVSTTEGNEPALRLYQAVGFQIVNRYLDFVQGEDSQRIGAG